MSVPVQVRPLGHDTMKPLTDSFGRRISYLRLSVTDRCDLRCVYCMAEKMTFLPKKDILSLEEMTQLARIFIQLGISKIRLTGGEPLVRRNVGKFISSVGRLPELAELTLTTNGMALNRYASLLARAGVRRINVSLDTLSPSTFHRVTRGGDIIQLFEGLQAAKKAGLAIKINRVALKDINDDPSDLHDMMQWCSDNGYDLTLIELMPMAETGYARALHYVPLDAIEGQVRQRYEVTSLSERTGGPARYTRVRGDGVDVRLGWITPLTGNFCHDCNRVRVTATGRLYLCLGQDNHVDLRATLRTHGEDATVNAIIAAMTIKPEGHDFAVTSCQNNTLAMTGATARHMSVTGG